MLIKHNFKAKEPSRKRMAPYCADAYRNNRYIRQKKCECSMGIHSITIRAQVRSLIGFEAVDGPGTASYVEGGP